MVKFPLNKSQKDKCLQDSECQGCNRIFFLTGHLLVYRILHEEGGLNNNNRHGGGDEGVTVGCQQRAPPGSAGDYRQLSSTSGRNYSERINWGVMECCLPSLCLALAHRPVSRLTSHFALSSVIVGVADRDGNCQVVTIPYTDTL